MRGTCPGNASIFFEAIFKLCFAAEGAGKDRPTGSLGAVLVMVARFVAISIPFNLAEFAHVAISNNVSKAKIQDEKKDGISEHCYCCRRCHGNFVGFFLHVNIDRIEAGVR